MRRLGAARSGSFGNQLTENPHHQETHMYKPNLPMHLARALARPRLAAGVLVTLTLLSAACSNDSASRITAPSLPSSSSNGTSAAGADFAVLAGAAVTCTNSSVTGDVGVYPGTVVTPTNCAINGTVHAGDQIARRAFEAFLAEYDDVADTACTDFLNPVYGVETLTLAPGVYCSTAAVTFTGTTLQLVGPSDGIWIFKIGTSGVGALTGTNFSVVMTGGDPCNVTWWTAEAATITDSDAASHPFLGTILAGTAISVTGGAGAIANRLQFTGDAFAKTAVTMTDTDLTGCEGSRGNGNGNGNGNAKEKCNQGVGNGPEGCDPGNSNNRNPSNDERGGTPGNPGRKR